MSAPSSSSVDDDLANVTSKSLTMGPSIVAHLEYSSSVLPRKLHHGLYTNSLSDVSMMSVCNNTNINNGRSMVSNKNICRGPPPGFPDFPDCWQGETSSARRQHNIDDSIVMHLADKKRSGQNKCTTSKAKSKRQQRRLKRNAVNTYGITKRPAAAVGAGKTIKKRLRDERRVRRIEKVNKLQKQRRRKRDMGNLCRGLASIKC